MSDIKTSYNIDFDSIEEVVKCLESGTMKKIKNNTKVIALDQKKFEPYLDFTFVSAHKRDNILTTFYKKGDLILQFDLFIYRKNIAPEMEAFTKEVDKVNYYKKDSEYKKLLMELTVTKETTEYNYDLSTVNDTIKKYSDDEKKLIAQRKEVEEILNNKLKDIYNKRLNAIQENKQLYTELKKLSKDFYSSEKEKDEIKKYNKQYKKALKKIQNNKETVIELMDKISTLEKKLALYTSATFIHFPLSGLTITNITTEDYEKWETEFEKKQQRQRYAESSESEKKKKKKKKSRKSEDSEVESDAESSESDAESSKSEDSEVESETETDKKSKKKGGEYELEYIDNPDVFSVAVERKFDKIKREIKKSKNISKSNILSKYRF
jgi:hypothetical protein